jgi:PAS domain S-box-containing protein
MASTTPGPAPSPERPPSVGVAVPGGVDDPHGVADRLRLELVLRAGGFGTWVWDSASSVVRWDPELEAVFGWAAGTFPGTYDAWRSCLHPEDRDAVVAHVRDAVERRGTYEIRHRIVWPDGSVHWIEGLGQVTLGPDGTVTGTIGCARDVTHRVEAEERLAAAALVSASAAARTELLQSVTADLAGAVSVDDVVRALAANADGLSHAQGAAVGLLDRAGRTLVVSSSFGFTPRQMVGFEHVPVDAATPLSECVRTGQEIVLTRTQMIDRFPDLAEASAGTGSTLLAALPLVVGGSTLGALLLAFRGPVDAGQLDLRLLRAVATQSAQALDRARLIGRLGEVAEHLQSAMEPDRLPLVPGFELASVYRPGGDELEHVGGDWFDLLELDEGRFAFSVGDVMGRGVPASTTMTRIRTAIRAYASVDGAPLAVVSTLDRFARTEAPDDFVTLVYGVLDAATGDVRFVTAGHLPPVLVAEDRTARLVDDEAGVPLGLPGCRVEAELHLAPGATLLLFTDGLVERRDRGIDEGLGALLDAVRSTGTGIPLEEQLRELVATMTADGAADDDVSALMIRRGATP